MAINGYGFNSLNFGRPPIGGPQGFSGGPQGPGGGAPQGPGGPQGFGGGPGFGMSQNNLSGQTFQVLDMIKILLDSLRRPGIEQDSSSISANRPEGHPDYPTQPGDPGYEAQAGLRPPYRGDNLLRGDNPPQPGNIGQQPPLFWI